jgi:hypothetical protein
MEAAPEHAAFAAGTGGAFEAPVSGLRSYLFRASVARGVRLTDASGGQSHGANVAFRVLPGKIPPMFLMVRCTS